MNKLSPFLTAALVSLSAICVNAAECVIKRPSPQKTGAHFEIVPFRNSTPTPLQTLPSLADGSIPFADLSGTIFEVVDGDRNVVKKMGSRGGLVVYTPPLKYFEYPIKPGSSWNQVSGAVGPDLRGSVSLKAQAKGCEDIQTSDGKTIQAMRIEYGRTLFFSGGSDSQSITCVVPVDSHYQSPKMFQMCKSNSTDFDYSVKFTGSTETTLTGAADGEPLADKK